MLVPTVSELSAVRNLLRGRDLTLLRPACQAEFDKVLSEVRVALRRLGSHLDSVDRALLTAICVLTGRMSVDDDDLMPHYRALAGLVGAVPGDRASERRRIAVDCAIAYGCGWGRTPRASRSLALDEVWESAVDFVTQQISEAALVGHDFLSGPLRPLLNTEEAATLAALKDDRWVTAAKLAFRLIRPLHSQVETSGTICEIAANSDAAPEKIMADAPRLDFTRVIGPEVVLDALPAGARYVFEVVSGTAVSVQEPSPGPAEADEEEESDVDAELDPDLNGDTPASGRVLAAGPGSRFIVLAGDYGATEVSFPVEADLARKLRLKRGGRIVFTDAGESVKVRVWECGCGSWACRGRHRLSSWLPNAKIGLKDFINSAINGRDYPLKPKSFIAGMYYAYLSREGWGSKAGLYVAPLPRIRRVLMVKQTSPIDPVTGKPAIRQDLRENFLLLSPHGNFRPARVVLCDACRLFRDWGTKQCDCGADPSLAKPTVVWKPLPPVVFDPFAAFRSYVARMLGPWWKDIEARERAQKESGTFPESDALQRIRREKRIYREVEGTFRRGDLVEVANLIRLARQEGFDLPGDEEEDEDED